MTREDPRIGEQIQDYRLEKKLASGGMGTIFLAQRAPNSGSERSILRVFKLLRHELANDQQGIHLFRREVKILQQLHHPNIVQLEDHGIHDTMGRYICMEYITGHTLKTHLRRNPNPPKHHLVIRWIEQICEALQYCHNKQIIHRDLKPENIFLQAPDTPAEALKLFDFGIASCPNVDEIPARHVGTPRYMPPEQIRNEPVDGRADLYALGVIMYELLTHRPLFAEKNSEKLRQAHLNQPPPTLGERRPDLMIPDSVEAMFRRLLAKSPSERPADAQAFVAQWKECLPPEPFEKRGGKMGFVVGQGDAFMAEMDDVETPPPVEVNEANSVAMNDDEDWDDEFASGSFWQTYKWPLMFLVLALVGLVAVVWGMQP